MFALHTTVILAWVRVKPSFVQLGLMHFVGFSATQRHEFRFELLLGDYEFKVGPFCEKWPPKVSTRTPCTLSFIIEIVSENAPIPF